MKYKLSKPKRWQWLAFVTIFLAFIYSCRKDQSPGATSTLSATDPKVVEAKSWYEKTYPLNKRTNISTLATHGGNEGDIDFSQLILPDWDNASAYDRLKHAVLELPVETSGAQLSLTLSNNKHGNPVYKKEYSRSSFLLLNNGSGYKAYIMTVMADSAYVGNNIAKLEHNKYNKHDADFTGAVTYTTPKGEFISGWFYKNGVITGEFSRNRAGNISTAEPSRITVNSLKINSTQPCVDWYSVTYEHGVIVSIVYIDTTGDCGDHPEIQPGGGGGNTGGDGGGTGGGGNVNPPDVPPNLPPCPTINAVPTKAVNGVNPNPPGGSPDPGDGGFPPPEPDPQPCVIIVPQPADIKNNVTGCNGAVINTLLNRDLSGRIEQILQNTFNSSSKINLHFIESTNTQGAPTFSTTTNGLSNTLNVEIRINKNILPVDASQDYKASLIIHEVIHAYYIYQNFSFTGPIEATPCNS